MEHFVTHLKNIFKERCEVNDRYSLRAFAKSLDIPPSTLSEIINKKRPLSKKLSTKIGSSLKMSKDQIDAFINDQDNTKESHQQIALDSFYLISQWWHYAILQLIRTIDFKNNSKWIAKRLNIEIEQAQEALTRLIRVGILETNKDGDLIDVTQGMTSHLVNNFTNHQLKDFQIKAHEKAVESIKNDSIEFRDNTSMTMAINKDSIKIAKEEIRKFRRRLTKKLEQNLTPDEVYQLTIGLNPLTKLNIKEVE